MKKRNLTKVFALTLCLTFVLSSVVLAKSSISTTNTVSQVCDSVSIPEDGELPRK